MFRDIRCDQAWRHGPHSCLALLFRVSTDLMGTIEMKCPRCRRVQEIRINAPARLRTVTVTTY